MPSSDALIKARRLVAAWLPNDDLIGRGLFGPLGDLFAELDWEPLPELYQHESRTRTLRSTRPFRTYSWPTLERLLPALLRIVELHRGWIEGIRVEVAPGPTKR